VLPNSAFSAAAIAAASGSFGWGDGKEFPVFD
jgi:hypothetical protein